MLSLDGVDKDNAVLRKYGGAGDSDAEDAASVGTPVDSARGVNRAADIESSVDISAQVVVDLPEVQVDENGTHEGADNVDTSLDVSAQVVVELPDPEQKPPARTKSGSGWLRRLSFRRSKGDGEGQSKS
eukprot:GFYU01061886.1.p2 GENE.GFYU01061886.1~~GFYU01061886.1.p2  ORF type:complete len:129 (-),score=27.34 GFYU01061886.1:65-451(-)